MSRHYGGSSDTQKDVQHSQALRVLEKLGRDPRLSVDLLANNNLWLCEYYIQPVLDANSTT